MSTDSKFINGLIVKAPNEKAPDYVKAKISIKREELIAWLQTEHGEWINADIKVSQGGKWYAAVDDWKPDSQRGQQSSRPARQQSAPQRQAPQQSAPLDDFSDDDIPF